ncbi:MAG: hypothetical protein CVT49_00040 [candidate division Zixibacteria bacterium HGW-Zixibacteria-1]|nr:MAG: hypothetical protein CVT49_00040 [candidate division Zixibacteria bacterium HGW-Zixibacteria-1]
MDKHRLALRYLDKAKKIMQQYKSFQLAYVELNRANVLFEMNMIRKARGFYEKAAAIYHNNGMHVGENKANYALAFILFFEDRFTESIRLFEKVYEKSKELADPVGAANALLDMAEINIQLTQYSTTIMLADQIIPEFHRLGLINEEARSYYFASVARIKLKDFDLAATQLRRAEHLFKKENNQFWLGMVNAAKSRLYRARGRYKQALQYAADSGISYARSGHERHRLDAEIMTFETVLASGDYERAIKLTVPLLKRRLTSHQKHNLRFLIGKCYYQKGDYSSALKEFKAAVKIIEKMLKGLYPDEIRFFFVMDRYESYQMMIDCLLKLGRVEDSFLSNLRALEVINHRTTHETETGREISPELIEKRNNLRAALKKLNQSTKGGQRGVESVTTYNSLEHKLWSNERKIRTIVYPEREYLGPDDFYQGRDIYQYIESEETIVSFFSSNEMTGAFCASGQKVQFIKFAILPKELDILLRKLHFIFENAVFGQRDVDRSYKISEHYLNIIYQKIIEPLLSSIPGQHVIFVADGIFGQIPFMALKDGQGRYIKDRFRINTIINPQDLKNRSGILKNLKSKRNAVFAVSSDLLPLIEIEARQIKSIFRKSRLFIDDRANCMNLTNELKEADGFLHIAAHASRSSENPLFSRILMNDGPFFPFDLFQSGVKAELVTLSGCQTAAPGLYYGNSFSLAKAFYQAGSHHVLATLWPVSDKLSMLFMINFYETLADVGNVYQAYQSAVDQIIDITDNPAFWSSFVLLGT